jgi:hypothetical protein
MPPIVAPGPGAIPESQRIAKSACDATWITVPRSLACTSVPSNISTNQAIYMSTMVFPPTEPVPMNVVDNGAYQRIQAPLDTATATVGTVPASVTLRRVTQQIQINESDPYNPVTRFAKYFPAPPLPYVCPERLPSNEPLPPETVCMPPQRFQGSAPGR